MSRFLVHLLGLVAVGLLATPVWSQDVSALRGGVVKITSTFNGKPRHGTGFVVKVEDDVAYIVTAHHVVEGDKKPQVTFFHRQNVDVVAELRRSDVKTDAALLMVRGRANLPAQLRALDLETGEEAKPGEDVHTIGFTRGLGEWAVTKATIASQDGLTLTLSGPIDEGVSGAPLLHHAKVVGLITDAQDKSGRATTAHDIARLLKSWGVALTDSTAEKKTARVDDARAKPRASSPAASKPLASSARVPQPADSDSIAANSSRRMQEYDDTARAAIDKLDDPAPRASVPRSSDRVEAPSGQLTWEDQVLRFVGTFDPDRMTLEATAYERSTGATVGKVQANCLDDVQSSAEVVVLSCELQVPPDSTTPRWHQHMANLHFEPGPNNSAVLLKNCPTFGQCFPARGFIVQGDSTAERERNSRDLQEYVDRQNRDAKRIIENLGR